MPACLEFDESRALAREAVHAVAAVVVPETDNALRQLAGHEDDAVAPLAVRLLRRRSTTSTADSRS